MYRLDSWKKSLTFRKTKLLQAAQLFYSFLADGSTFAQLCEHESFTSTCSRYFLARQMRESWTNRRELIEEQGSFSWSQENACIFVDIKSIKTNQIELLKILNRAYRYSFRAYNFDVRIRSQTY